MKLRIRVLCGGALLALVATLAGCGGSGASSAASNSVTGNPSTAAVVGVAMPSSVSVVTATHAN